MWLSTESGPLKNMFSSSEFQFPQIKQIKERMNFRSGQLLSISLVVIAYGLNETDAWRPCGANRSVTGEWWCVFLMYQFMNEMQNILNLVEFIFRILVWQECRLLLFLRCFLKTLVILATCVVFLFGVQVWLTFVLNELIMLDNTESETVNETERRIHVFRSETTLEDWI